MTIQTTGTIQTGRQLVDRPTSPGKAGRRLRRGLLAAAAAGLSLLFVAPSPAYAGGPYGWASGGSIDRRLTVCAEDLAVRHERGGYAFDYLQRGQTFYVKDVDAEFGSEWVYGFAYGNVDSPGYVQNGWFCNG